MDSHQDALYILAKKIANQYLKIDLLSESLKRKTIKSKGNINYAQELYVRELMN